MWWPAIGAVVVGVVGFLEPRTLGVGYDNIDQILSGSIVGYALAALVVLKLISWSVALGSGTSGGTLAPLFTIGGGLGALAGSAIGSAEDKKKCEQWWASRGAWRGGYHPGGYATTYHHGGYGYGYGWYTPGVVVTTIINGAPLVTETVETTTRTYYENVPVRKRYVAKKKWKPKRKPVPRCVC